MCDLDWPSTVWNEQIVRARKPHRCYECRTPIPVGCNHVRIGSLCDGNWDTYRMHWECTVLWRSMSADLCGQSVIIAGGLDEELEQYRDEEGLPYRERFEAIKAHYSAFEASQ